MNGKIALALLLALLLCGCARAGRIEVLTPLTAEEAEETRRTAPPTETDPPPPPATEILEFTLNLHSQTFHMRADCTHAKRISAENRALVTDCAENLIALGYHPCKSCSKCFVPPADTDPDGTA